MEYAGEGQGEERIRWVEETKKVLVEFDKYSNGHYHFSFVILQDGLK